MISALLILFLTDIDWSQIDTKQYLPLQVGNWWEYVAEKLCYGCPPKIDTISLGFQDTIICRITHSKIIEENEYFYFDKFPFYLDEEGYLTECEGIYVRYNENNDLVGFWDKGYWRWLWDERVLPFTELKQCIQTEDYSTYPECGVTKLCNSEFIKDEHLCLNFNTLFYIPDFAEQPLDLYYGRIYFWGNDCGYWLRTLRYKFGITEFKNTAVYLFDTWLDWHWTRAVVNGVYYSNVEEAKPTTWLDVKQGK
jgi:hypothetical protein